MKKQLFLKIVTGIFFIATNAIISSQNPHLLNYGQIPYNNSYSHSQMVDQYGNMIVAQQPTVLLPSQQQIVDPYGNLVVVHPPVLPQQQMVDQYGNMIVAQQPTVLLPPQQQIVDPYGNPMVVHPPILPQQQMVDQYGNPMVVHPPAFSIPPLETVLTSSQRQSTLSVTSASFVPKIEEIVDDERDKQKTQSNQSETANQLPSRAQQFFNSLRTGKLTETTALTAQEVEEAAIKKTEEEKLATQQKTTDLENRLALMENKLQEQQAQIEANQKKELEKKEQKPEIKIQSKTASIQTK